MPLQTPMRSKGPLTQAEGPRRARGGLFRRAVRSLLVHPRVLEWAASKSAGNATILMMHRFTSEADGSGSLAIPDLTRHLQWLRGEDFNLVSLGWLISALREGASIPPKTVAMTVDDGYEDFGRLALPVFQYFRCPVTVFLVTDFIDRRAWLWWDSIEYLIRETRHAACRFELRGRLYDFSWHSLREKASVAQSISSVVKWTTSNERQEIVTSLADRLEVTLPRETVPSFSPLTWDAIRAAESELVSFGPHSTTHPILSMETAAVAREEVLGAWHRVRAELQAPLPCFCFPNGDLRSFGRREMDLVREAGMTAAVSTVGDYVSQASAPTGGAASTLLLPRIQIESEFDRFAQVVTGLDRLKWRITGLRPRQPDFSA